MYFFISQEFLFSVTEVAQNILGKFTSFSGRVVTLALRRKHEKYSSFFFFFTNHDKEKAKQFMMMLGDHEAAHFVRQGVAVMQFFTKNNANFVKIIAIWK